MLKKFKSLRRFFLGAYRGIKLKLYNNKFSFGKSFFCGRGCFIATKNKIIIGDNFYMGNNCHLASNLNVGDNVMLGSNVAFVGGDHRIDDKSVLMNSSGRDLFKTTTIKNNVWIGHGSIIMHGILINEGSIVAAGSVVTKNIPKNTIWGGNPAKLIKRR